MKTSPWLAALALGAVAAFGGAAADVRPMPGPGAEAGVQIDRLLAQEIFLQHTDTPLAPVVDDETFLRRATLDLVGELPSPAEITLFLLDASTDKRARLIDRLLTDERFGRNWGRFWRDVILYRRSEDRALVVSRALEGFLADALNKNTPWDKIAQEFILAKGNVAQQGQTGVIIAQGADANDVAAEVSRVFLGIQIQCAQCHDHPTDRWKREQFHEFAAFFPRTALRPVFQEGRVRGFEVASFDFAPRYRPQQAMPGRGELEHYMPDLKDPSAKGKLMTPTFFATGRKLKPGSTDLERRASLARWLTSREDAWFAKAFVNRVWAELVGEGFYEPIDDMGPDRTPTAPQTFAYLADAFAAKQYDVKWLLRTIMNTTTYQRESRPRRLPSEPAFTANRPQRLRGDQLFSVLTTALDTTPPATFGGARYPGFNPGPRFSFNLTFGYDPSSRRDEVSGSIPQALSLMNSRLVNSPLNDRGAKSVLTKLLSQTSDDEEVTLDLYLRFLARQPREDELAATLEYVRSLGSDGSADRRTEAFEDVVWALVNRTEFLHRN